VANTFGKVLGQPKIKIGYGSYTGRVQRDIQQRTRKGGLRMKRARIKQFGFGGR
jgi:hypothetical protein